MPYWDKEIRKCRDCNTQFESANPDRDWCSQRCREILETKRNPKTKNSCKIARGPKKRYKFINGELEEMGS